MGERHWEAHLQVLSDSRWSRHCSMTDEEISNIFVTGNVIFSSLPACLSSQSCQSPLSAVNCHGYKDGEKKRVGRTQTFGAILNFSHYCAIKLADL